jgi:hypothetical protein
MSYVPEGQAMVDSAADRVGYPREIEMMIRVVANNRMGAWGRKILATGARARRLKLSES